MSKVNQVAWVRVTQPEAAEYARNMYSNSKYESDLINSYSWDTAIVFIEKYSTGNSNYANNKSVNTSKLNTGKAGDVVCNIHDMASNVREWSTERASNSGRPCVDRGATYDRTDYYTAHRNYSVPGNYTTDISFRVILY